MSGDSFRGELSFVDLALVLVKRRYILLGALILFSGFSALYVVNKEPVYEFESLYQLPIADKGGSQLFNAERVANAVVFARWPAAKDDFRDEHSRGVPFRLSVTPDTDLGSISLKSRARSSDAASVESVHELLLKELSADLNSRFEAFREDQQAQREQVEATIDELSAREQAGSELGRAYQNLLEFEERLASLEPGNIVAVARPSESPVSVAKSMLLVALLALSIFGAFLLAFFVEFVSVVRKAIQASDRAQA